MPTLSCGVPGLEEAGGKGEDHSNCGGSSLSTKPIKECTSSGSVACRSNDC